ncbi:hypothetical protein [Azospirillum soli]|uniref:hypothetical protein n=1 Tax=Azospirillum soli TaxID=1304799 RepID=UPI001AE243A5|nr:hypothetical protein [Azospirillum soli]MBP2311887.1 hypothetical protein [Azospirillum soli]
MGVATRVHHDPDGLLIFERSQDCTPILDRNKALQNDGDGYSPSRELRRVASIPNVLIEKWLNEEGINLFDPDHWPAIQRKLNSSEYLYLRTAPGQV